MRICVCTEPHPDFPETPFSWVVTEVVDGEEMFIGLGGFSATIKDAFLDGYEVFLDYEKEMKESE